MEKGNFYHNTNFIRDASPEKNALVFGKYLWF